MLHQLPFGRRVVTAKLGGSDLPPRLVRHLCQRGTQPKVLQFLLEKTSPTQLGNRDPLTGQTALHFAVNRQDVVSVRMIIKRSAAFPHVIDAEDNSHETSLMLAWDHVAHCKSKYLYHKTKRAVAICILLEQAGANDRHVLRPVKQERMRMKLEWGNEI